MKTPKATTDYAHGQMMGMLVIIQLLEQAKETQKPVTGNMIQTIKNVCTRDLAQYLERPEEDVLLLVDEQLRKI